MVLQYSCHRLGFGQETIYSASTFVRSYGSGDLPCSLSRLPIAGVGIEGSHCHHLGSQSIDICSAIKRTQCAIGCHCHQRSDWWHCHLFRYLASFVVNQWPPIGQCKHFGGPTNGPFATHFVCFLLAVQRMGKTDQIIASIISWFLINLFIRTRWTRSLQDRLMESFVCGHSITFKCRNKKI